MVLDSTVVDDVDELVEVIHEMVVVELTVETVVVVDENQSMPLSLVLVSGTNVAELEE